MDFFSLLGNSDAAQNQDRSHLVSLSEKLDVLLAHLDIASDEPGVPALSASVRAHISKGNKIGAIKQYRDETGADLSDAKDAVEGKTPAADGVSWDSVEHKINLLMKHHGIAAPEPAKNGLIDEVVRLLRHNNKIEAIKIYREAKNIGLKEAKDDVDAIEARLRAR